MITNIFRNEHKEKEKKTLSNKKNNTILQIVLIK
jgi:hypothetical protein